MTDPQLPEDLQARKHAAEVAKLEADARKAAADAETAEANAAKARTESVNAEQAQVPLQQREATARKAIAEANKDAAAARTAQLSAFIPDLSTVKASTLETKEGGALLGSFLTFGALERVATEIASRIVSAPMTDGRLFITSESDIASSDAAYHEVSTGLKQLADASQRLLNDLQSPTVMTQSASAAGAAISALAGAVPSLLSLFSAQRTLTTGATTVGDVAAAAAVAGALRGLTGAARIAVVFENLRLMPASAVMNASRDVSEQRQKLLVRKLQLEDDKGRSTEQVAAERRRVASLEKAISDAGKNPPDGLGLQREEALKTIEGIERKMVDMTLRLGLIDGLITSIDAFLAAIAKVPEGARRSPLAAAALHEHLRPAEIPSGTAAAVSTTSTHVLLIKAQPGQSQQLLNDKPFWFDDKFSTIVDVSVTYVLIATKDSIVLSAGTVTKTARAYGTVGEMPELILDD
jgi:hypothetical protein